MALPRTAELPDRHSTAPTSKSLKVIRLRSLWPALAGVALACALLMVRSMYRERSATELLGTSVPIYGCFSPDPEDGLPTQEGAAHFFQLEPEAALRHLELPQDATSVLADPAAHAWALEQLSAARFLFDELVRAQTGETARITEELIDTGRIEQYSSPPPGKRYTKTITPDGPAYLADDEYADLAFLASRMRSAPGELRSSLVDGIQARRAAH